MCFDMKKSLLSLVLFLISVTAIAIPARPGQVKTITLADGTTIQARLVGDEHGHYWLSADGRAFREQADASYYKEVSLEQVRQRAQAHRAKANARRVASAPRKASIGHFGDYTGQKKGIIILVNYSNLEFREAHDRDFFERMANEKDFHQDSFRGSVYDYFYAQSNGEFELTFDVVGPVQLSNTMEYYGKNFGPDNLDSHAAGMIVEACQLVDEEVNFADYDWDGDGEVDQVYVIYPGKGEADGGTSFTIWPHEWELSEAALSGDGDGSIELDGVTIDTYACGSELNGGARICGIGTLCHEFSHCLGFPDFYDIDYSGGVGLDVWDLMSGGCYNGNGYCPAGYTSYERWMAGWLEPIELQADTVVADMKSLQEGGDAYIMYNDGHRDEYYMLENRQQVAWDEKLPAHGLLIVYVDFDLEVWENNQPNDNPRHQRMTWIPADGKIETYKFYGNTYVSEEGMKTDPYPSGDNNRFTNISYPAAKLYHANTDGRKLLNKSVLDIAEASDGTISFNFLNEPMERKDPELAFDVDTVTVEAGTADFQAPELRNPYDLEVTYSSSDKSLATVDVFTGSVVIGDTPGKVVIEAYYEGEEFYNPGSASYVIDIAVPAGIEIREVVPAHGEGFSIYDLSGRRVSSSKMPKQHGNNDFSVPSVSSVSSVLPKGVYIVNGRKVVVK